MGRAGVLRQKDFLNVWVIADFSASIIRSNRVGRGRISKDHISFFLREPKILFPGEALGKPVMERDDLVKVEFLTSSRIT